ncbi:nucleotidyltransferase family protein [Dinghuibacter silviterrae]|uniref:D-glycero-alpha-D-manno-heptose 1-phosphate guanylyltransferase n=1 Tax=Dinghuibacter silviterrae TaxID=1539049 RepID=A0A4R8DV70_9BACT|nr:nucleotidyltransferase family protein [Dinghuibacter silviterrae]TDX02304.1 D-glycero-alpha-D-manno-heptose 1-phosphate guanylyltransferase [Dinghuibacter silviterrae]
MKEAIILAGGLGTRLRSAVPDLPKCMAPVSGRPFLAHVVDYLLAEGVYRLVLSLGYKHEVIEAYMKRVYSILDFVCVVEKEPLGTGGAIREACKAAEEAQVLVANGDTLFQVDIPALSAFHKERGALATLALKPMQDFDRYGVVDVEPGGRIIGFEEKKPRTSGLINGGVYGLSVKEYLAEAPAGTFSFEKDFLEPRVSGGRLYGYTDDAYFIDIGIPADYERAQKDLLL